MDLLQRELRHQELFPVGQVFHLLGTPPVVNEHVVRQQGVRVAPVDQFFASSSRPSVSKPDRAMISLLRRLYSPARSIFPGTSMGSMVP